MLNGRVTGPGALLLGSGTFTLNRRGYSNFVYCVSCQNVIQCKYCDKTMTYHRAAATHAHGASNAESAAPAFPAVGAATLRAPLRLAIVTATAMPRDLNDRVGFFDSSLIQTFSN